MRSIQISLFSLTAVAYAAFTNGHHLDVRQQCSISSPAPISSPSPISGGLPTNDSAYVGSPARASPLKPNVHFQPEAALLHSDSGNTGTTDRAGPLGCNMSLSSAVLQLGGLLWGDDGQLTAGYTVSQNGTRLYGLAAMDPKTLGILGIWYPPDANQTMNFAYMELLLKDNLFVVTSKQGLIYVVQRQDCGNGQPSFTVVRTVDVASAKVLAPGEALMNGMMDADGNIWFTTGAIIGLNQPPQPSTTIGYVEANSTTIHTLHIPNQMVENGFAVNDKTVFVVTGPSGPTNATDTSGYMYALTAGAPGTTSVTTVWSTSYDAGTVLKPGGFARGSGSTPTLLGNQYVSITDNASPQVNLLILHQAAQEGSSSNKNTSSSAQVHCRVPLFKPNASANDIGTITHADSDGTYGVVVLNDYNAPPIYQPATPAQQAQVNAAQFNDMGPMAPGVVRVDVTPDGGCKTRWEADIRMKSVPVLSTATGLLYGYVQDAQRAAEGEWVWYAVAIDWQTGKEVWRVRTGAGGVFNDNFATASVKDGVLYQAVTGGMLLLKDGDEANGSKNVGKYVWRGISG